MKQSLIILSSLATLALTNNAVLNIVNHNNTTVNSNLNSNASNASNAQAPTSLFNNTFGYLNQGSWITNQSTTDYKYYSYDTSHAVGNLSDGTPARNAFIVDSNGNLIINSALKLSDLDKNMLNNIQSQMIAHRQISAIKNNYNPYSKSIYSDSYFNGDNSSWKYWNGNPF